jgi:hypothetical protein
MTSRSRPFEHLSRWLARLAVERVDRNAAYLVVRMPRLDHVVLDVRSEPVLRAEDGRQGAFDAPMRSTMCWSWRSTDAGLQTIPTRRPDRRPEASRRSDPGITGISRLYVSCLASDADALIDYPAFGGQPRLLRPRREPIEPLFRLAPSP